MARRTLIFIVACMFMFLASMGNSGEFVFIAGKGYDVCESYWRNIHSFNNLPYDVVCERPTINPKFTNFKKPDWKKLDAWEQRKLVHEFEFYVNTIYKFEKDEAKKRIIGNIDNAIKNGYRTLHETRIDVDNDGKDDHLYRVEYAPPDWTCEPARYVYGGGPTGMYYVAWNDQDNTINKRLSSFLGGLRWGFFTFNGKTYYDYYSSGVLLIMKSGAEICKFEYRDKAKRGE